MPLKWQNRKSVKSHIRLWGKNREGKNGLAQEDEGAAATKDMNQLYDTSKPPIGKYQQLADPIKNKEENLLTNSDDQLKRGAEHFKELVTVSFRHRSQLYQLQR